MVEQDIRRDHDAPRIRVIGPDDGLDDALRRDLAACWQATANAGGAVGFPWPPVSTAQARSAVDALADQVTEGHTHIVVATDDVGVAGWVALDRNAAPLVAHWATVRRLQTHPRVRGTGLGRRLLDELTRLARDVLGLHHLHLSLRGDMGLEPFYEHLGWEVVGRWPGALRLAAGDERDEVLMFRRL